MDFSQTLSQDLPVITHGLVNKLGGGDVRIQLPGLLLIKDDLAIVTVKCPGSNPRVHHGAPSLAPCFALIHLSRPLSGYGLAFSIHGVFAKTTTGGLIECSIPRSIPHNFASDQANHLQLVECSRGPMVCRFTSLT